MSILRVAICMFGEMRNSPECLQSLRDMVISPFIGMGAKVDVFIATRLDPWCKDALSMNPRMVKFEDEVYQDPSILLTRFNPLHFGETGSDPGHSTQRRSILYQCCMHAIRKCEDVYAMKKSAEQQDGAKYDWVARVRPDVGYNKPLPIDQLAPGTIHFPDNDQWPTRDKKSGKPMLCLSEKFFIGPNDLMDRIFSNARADTQQFCLYHQLHGEALTGWRVQNMPWKLLPYFEVVRAEDKYQYTIPTPQKPK